jgi:hypothetical protein
MSGKYIGMSGPSVSGPATKPHVQPQFGHGGRSAAFWVTAVPPQGRSLTPKQGDHTPIFLVNAYVMDIFGGSEEGLVNILLGARNIQFALKYHF